MNYSVRHIPIQTLVTGGELLIHAHQFHGSISAPRIYIQANLHGPEIFGSALAIKLIDYLHTHPDDVLGSLTIVPQANPMGVQAQIYGYQIGRWNQQTGNNWNRIFSTEKLRQNDSIEEVLKYTLGELACDHEIILDIHTSGAACIPHLFTHADDVAFFSSLHPGLNVLVSMHDYYGAFDEFCRLNADRQQQTIHTATWEASSHGAIDRALLEERMTALLGLLRAKKILKGFDESVATTAVTVPLKKLMTLYAVEAGYFVWQVEPGASVRTGDVYGHVYNSNTGAIHEQRAEQDFLLVIRHPLQAIASGQELAEICLFL